MRFFYDWEFLEDGKTIDPISVGVVAENGNEYYAVNSHMDVERIGAHDWLAKNVVPHLPVETHTTDVITEYVVKGLKFSEGYTLDIELDHSDENIKHPRRIAHDLLDFFLANVDGHSGDIELWANFGAYDHVRLMQTWGAMIDRPYFLPMQTDDLQTLWKLKGRPSELPVQDPETVHHPLYDARHDRDLFDFLVELPNSNWPLR
jgi:3' exoribonuclease, RNase T-like